MGITPRRRASTRPGGTEQIAAHKEGRAAPPRPAISDDEIRASIVERPVEAAAGARHRPDDLFAARRGHGAPSRRRHHQRGLGHRLQRADLSRLHAVPAQLRRRVHAAAERRRVAAQLHRRAGALRAAIRLRRLQSESRSVGRLLDRTRRWAIRYWYPIYEKMVELDVPAMIHVSAACNPAFHTTGSHYLNGDTAAFMQCLTSDLFKNFPDAEVHHPAWRRRGAVSLGPVPRHRAGHEAAAADRACCCTTCSSTPACITCPGQELLAKVIPADNILFASEMIGAVRGIDPETGLPVRRHQALCRAIDAVGGRQAEDLRGECAAGVPRLSAQLGRQGVH